MPTEKARSASRLGKIAVGAVLFGLFILGSHSASANLFPPPLDKLAHVLVFAILAASISTAWPQLNRLTVLLLVVLIGLADEYHQLFVPQRQPGWDDTLADIAGGVAGILMLWQYRRCRTA
jgi:VanZ family protein